MKKSRQKNTVRMIRIMLIAMVCSCLLLNAEPVLAQTPARYQNVMTVVPANEQISDEEARLALARLIAYDDHRLEESVREYLHFLRARPGDVVARRELAGVFMRQKKYDDAVRELMVVLRDRPDDPDAQRALGQIDLWSGKYPQAIDRLEKLRIQKKADSEALLALARAYSWSGRHKEAREAYALALLQIKDAGAELYTEIADSYRHIGKPANAVGYYRHAAKMKPDDPVFQRKLGLALSWSGQDHEAMLILEACRQKQPQDREVAVELARIHARQKAWAKAQAILEDLATRFHGDPDIMIELADIEAAQGHATRCRDLYLQVLSQKKDQRMLELRYADRMSLWGDFYGAERIYRQQMRIDPADKDVTLKLAALLAGMQRYEEAEGLYQTLLIRFPGWEKPLLELARLKLLEKNEESALIFAERFLSQKPGSTEGFTLKADALAGLGRFAEAAAVYEIIEKQDDYRNMVKLRMGKMALLQQNDREARRYFEEAYRQAPEMPDTRFYHAGLAKAADGAFLREFSASASTAQVIDQWAQLYAQAGLNKIAAGLYRDALKRDPAYFPARIGLAEILAVDHQYEESLKVYRELSAAIPDASKVMIGEARVLSWSRQYEKAVDLYERIHGLNPADPVPLREMARVAAWGKMYMKSDRIYRRLAEDPIDRQLTKAWSRLSDRGIDPDFDETVRALENQVSQGSVYEGYEQLRRAFDVRTDFIGSKEARLRFAELLPAYRIQKTTALESRAKALFREKRFAGALNVYGDLIGEAPGNQEAIFDRAQTACALGLCDLEGDLYRRLLRIDPLHGLARFGLKNKEIRTHPSLKPDYWYWKESGRGDLARITRNRTALSLHVPLFYRYQLQLKGLAWNEHPDYTDQTYQAEGYSLDLSGTVNAYVKGGIGWTHKAYRDRDLSDRDTGYGRLSFNLRDRVHLGVGFDRTDEIYNYFGLRQGMQADKWWVSAASDLTRKLNFSGQARHIVYGDNNSGQHYSLGAGYAFTDHPRIFKVIFSGEYRHTDAQSRSFYNAAGRLADMIHPYWTPQSYTASGVTLEWYHDISERPFCGGDLHFYDLRTSVGTDSESNASVKLEGQWHYEFFHHWMIGLQGMIHRSREWNADSLYGTLMYRF